MMENGALDSDLDRVEAVLSRRALLRGAAALGAGALTFGLPGLAAAGTLRSETVEVEAGYRYHASWTDSAGRGHEVRARLPRAATDADLDAPLRFPLRASTEAQVQALRQWSRGLPAGVRLIILEQDRDSLKYTVEAPTSAVAQRTLNEAGEVAFRALKQFAKQNGFLVDRSRLVHADYPREIRSSAGPLGPLAEAMSEGLAAEGPRGFAKKALAFCQSIPYEIRKTGKDAGFRRPMSVLVRNRGDCDGKAALFLALLRARHGNLPMAVIIVPGHALVGVGLKPLSGEQTVRAGGEQLVVMEPVGPALLPIGQPGDLSKSALRAGEHDLFWVPAA